MEKEKLEKIKSLIRDIPDFPVKGVLFRDLTTMLKDGEAFRSVCEELKKEYAGLGVTKVVGIEARGFICGAVLAHELGAGFVPVRKPGKLPADTVQKTYSKEYGTDVIEIHRDAINENDVVVYGCCIRIGEIDEPQTHLRKLHSRAQRPRRAQGFPRRG